MKKLILFLTLVTLSFSANKWEYCRAIRQETDGLVTFLPFFEDSTSFSSLEFTAKYQATSRKYSNDSLPFVNPELIGLNKLGADGWELVHFENISTSHIPEILYYLKRKID